MKININNTEIELKFGYGFLRSLGSLWDCAGPVAVFEKFGKAASSLVSQIDGMDIEKLQAGDVGDVKIEITFDVVDVFCDIIWAAALEADSETILDQNEIGEFVFNNSEVMGEIVAEFMACMPRPKEEPAGKPTAAKKRPQGKKNP